MIGIIDEKKLQFISSKFGKGEPINLYDIKELKNIFDSTKPFYPRFSLHSLPVSISTDDGDNIDNLDSVNFLLKTIDLSTSFQKWFHLSISDVDNVNDASVKVSTDSVNNIKVTEIIIPNNLNLRIFEQLSKLNQFICLGGLGSFFDEYYYLELDEKFNVQCVQTIDINEHAAKRLVDETVHVCRDSYGCYCQNEEVLAFLLDDEKKNLTPLKYEWNQKNVTSVTDERTYEEFENARVDHSDDHGDDHSDIYSCSTIANSEDGCIRVEKISFGKQTNHVGTNNKIKKWTTGVNIQLDPDIDFSKCPDIRYLTMSGDKLLIYIQTYNGYCWSHSIIEIDFFNETWRQVNNETVSGYMGAIFSNVVINTENEKLNFCNLVEETLSTFIVRDLVDIVKTFF
jgi:hypothetical protein